MNVCKSCGAPSSFGSVCGNCRSHSKWIEKTQKSEWDEIDSFLMKGEVEFEKEKPKPMTWAIFGVLTSGMAKLITKRAEGVTAVQAIESFFKKNPTMDKGYVTFFATANFKSVKRSDTKLEDPNSKECCECGENHAHAPGDYMCVECRDALDGKPKEDTF